nr:transposase [Hymenolepis microstoma]
MQNWRRFLVKTRAKLMKDYQNHWVSISEQAISKRLKQLGMTEKEEYWILQELKQRVEMWRDVCLLANSYWKDKRERDFSIVFLLGTKNGYITITLTLTHTAKSTPRPTNVNGSKVMLCVWWDQLDIIYYELLESSETIRGERCRTQLMRLSRAQKKEKRPQYIERHDKVFTLQHDNARPSLVVQVMKNIS